MKKFAAYDTETATMAFIKVLANDEDQARRIIKAHIARPCYNENPFADAWLVNGEIIRPCTVC